MARRNAHNPDQLSLDFTARVDGYEEIKSRLIEAASEPAHPVSVESEMEACIEIAVAIKRTLRESGMSRDQLVDGINAYFGRTEEGAQKDPAECRKPLTIHGLNNHLSKPCDYPIPAYYLYAIHHVTGIVEPGATIVAAEGAQVATAEEVRLLQLGRLDETIAEMQKLKKQLKGGGR